MTYALPTYNRPLGNNQLESYTITSEAYSQALVDGGLLDVCDRALNRAAQVEILKLASNETVPIADVPDRAYLLAISSAIMSDGGVRNRVAVRLRQVIANNGYLHFTTAEEVIDSKTFIVSRIFGTYSNDTPAVPSNPRKIKVDDVLPIIELVIQNPLFMQNLKESNII